MGAGASVPEQIDIETCKTLGGESFDQAKWDELQVDGFISKEILIAQSDVVNAEQGKAATLIQNKQRQKDAKARVEAKREEKKVEAEQAQAATIIANKQRQKDAKKRVEEVRQAKAAGADPSSTTDVPSEPPTEAQAEPGEASTEEQAQAATLIANKQRQKEAKKRVDEIRSQKKEEAEKAET